MKKFFQKQREVVILLAYAGVFVGLIYLVILPLLTDIDSVNNQIQEESMKQEIAGQQMKDLPKLQQQYDALEKDASSADVLLDKNQAVILIERLEKIAQDSDNKISISVQEVPAQKNTTASSVKANAANVLVNALPSPDYLQMSIKLDGNYNTIMNFIDILESSEYYSDIVAIQIKQNEKNDKTATGFGVVNPFIPNSKIDMKIAGGTDLGELEASLDTVFYTKK